MGLVHKCDKCGRIILRDNGIWSSNNIYNINSKKPLKIQNQIVQVKIGITLECGNTLELCNSCASKIITKYWYGDKKKYE